MHVEARSLQFVPPFSQRRSNSSCNRCRHLVAKLRTGNGQRGKGKLQNEANHERINYFAFCFCFKPQGRLYVFFLLLFLVCSRGCERSLFRNVGCGGVRIGRQRWRSLCALLGAWLGRCTGQKFIREPGHVFFIVALLLLFITSRRSILLYSPLQKEFKKMQLLWQC